MVIESNSSYQPSEMIDETDSAGGVEAALSEFRHIQWSINRIPVKTGNRTNRVQIPAKYSESFRFPCAIEPNLSIPYHKQHIPWHFLQRIEHYIEMFFSVLLEVCDIDVGESTVAQLRAT